MAGFESRCVVVKFHDKEKYAALVSGGTKSECLNKAAYCRGLYHDLSYIKFGVYPEWVWDAAKEIEQKDGGEMYDILPTLSWS